MLEYLLIGILLVALPISNLIMYRYAKRVGAQSFFELIAKFGYDNKIKSFKVLNQQVPKGGIVFLGDSITQDYNVYEHFPGRLVYNRGIGGDTTPGVINRLDVSVDELKPSVVVLLIGTNDYALLKTNTQDIFERYQEIVSKIKHNNPETKIMIQSVYPVNETLDPMTVLPRSNHEIDKLNALLKTIEGVIYLDIQKILKDEHGRFHKDYTLEGLHVSPKGYELISKEIEKLL